MWNKIKNGILSYPVQSVVLSLIVVVIIGGTSYVVFQKDNSSDNNINGKTSDGSTNSCTGLVQIGAVSVEKDPSGDPEAWLRFDYTTTAKDELNCQYTIAFYDSREEVIRTISNVEDTFQSPSGQIYNGYSSTPYQEGMTAKVIVP